jgi:tetratricopeptide (TPR) repeat protein
MSAPALRRPRPSFPLVLFGCALAVALLAAATSGPAPAGAAAAAEKKPAKAGSATKKGAAAKPAVSGPDSIARLEAVVRRDTTNAKNQYRLGLAYLDNDRPQEAMRAFNAAVTSKPDYLEAWVNLGASQDAIGHGYVAREAYRKALALQPEDEIALCRLASSFYAVGIKDSAMMVLHETLVKHPRSHCSYFTLGVAFADGGMFREAIAAWEKVIEYAPDSPEAKSATETVHLLKEYLGKDSLRVASTAKPGVPAGSGGPGEPLKGGEMNTTKPAPVPAAHSSADGHDHGDEKKKDK